MLKSIAIIAVLSAVLLSVSAKPWDAVARTDGNWPARHATFLNETKTIANKIQVVFFGDSITEGWAGNGKEIWDKYYGSSVDTGVHAVNYGIGGDKTENLIWRIDNGEFTGLMPKLIVLKIGTNNLGSDTDEDIAKGITAVVDDLHNKTSATTKILLLGVLPRSGDALQTRIKNINKIIAKLNDDKTVWFLDMWEQFSSATSTDHLNDDLFVSDKLHLAKPGYQMWAQTMEPLFNKLIAM